MRPSIALLAAFALTSACEQPLDIVRAAPTAAPDDFAQAARGPVSWLGQSGEGPGAANWLQQRISDVFVTADGAVYTYADRRSTGSRGQILRSGRLIAHLQDDPSGGGNTITVAGDVVLVDEYEQGPHVARFAAATGLRLPDARLALPTDARVEGLAVGGEELFVSDAAGDRVWVFAKDAIDAAAPRRSFVVDGPGELAIDHAGRLWIARPRRGDRPGQVQAFDPSGTPIAAIDDADDPRDVACDGSTLFVADAGPARQIRTYDVTGPSPMARATIGAAGGALAPPRPGTLAPGSFVQPNAVGVDAAGNVVVNDAQAGFGSELTAFDAAGQPSWSASANGYLFDSAVLDPEDEAKAYAHAHRYAIDWTASPGPALGRAAGFLRDPDRFATLENAPNAAPIALRRLFGARFLFLVDNARGTLGIYRLPDMGEVMRPAARLERGTGRWWRDGDGDGRVGDAEVEPPIDGTGGHVVWVDADGAVWTGAAGGKLTWWPATGLDATGAPAYPVAARRQISVPAPFSTEGVRRLFHAPDEDALYLAGFTADRPLPSDADPSLAGSTLARYVRPFAPQGPTLDWVIPIDDAPPGMEAQLPRALDVVGRYLFAVQTRGTIIVRDLAERGRIVHHVGPLGVFLHTEGAKAFRRDNGEHVLFMQDSLAGRIAVHRWDPRAPQALAATRSGTGVTLAWTAPVLGPARGYLVYRANEPGKGYRRITDVPLSTIGFVDDGAPSAPVWYRVSAIGAAGDESYSYEATAAPN